nr:DMT family transporter [Pseudenhygromyxa sp. WMMC2535]
MAAEPGALAGGSWRGDLLALSGALTAAVHLAIGRHVHARLGDALPVEGYFVIMNLVAALALWAVVFARGVAVTPAQTGAGATALLAILWLGLIPGVIGHGLLNWSVRRVPVHTVAMAVMLEPVGAAGIAWLALGESVAPREGLGALVLLAGVGLGLPRRRP